MKNKILENWEEIKKVEKLMKEKTGDPQGGFNLKTYFFGNEGRHLMIPFMYRGKKGKKGAEEFTLSFKEIEIYANFCPFSGKQLYEEINIIS